MQYLTNYLPVNASAFYSPFSLPSIFSPFATSSFLFSLCYILFSFLSLLLPLFFSRFCSFHFSFPAFATSLFFSRFCYFHFSFLPFFLLSLFFSPFFLIPFPSFLRSFYATYLRMNYLTDDPFPNINTQTRFILACKFIEWHQHLNFIS